MTQYSFMLWLDHLMTKLMAMSNNEFWAYDNDNDYKFDLFKLKIKKIEDIRQIKTTDPNMLLWRVTTQAMLQIRYLTKASNWVGLRFVPSFYPL